MDAAQPREPILLLAESLFATVGLSPLLDRAAPPVRLTKSDLATGEAMPARISRIVQRFVERSEFEADDGDAVPFQLRRCVHLLADGPTADELSGRLRGLPPELALPFFDVAGRGLELLRNNAPALTVETLSGPVTVDPGLVASSRFRRTWTAVEDPMSVMRDFAAGVVSREQIKALEIAYPEIYDLARRQIVMSIAAARGKVKSFSLAPRKDRVLQTFLQTIAMDSRLAAELQSIYGGGDIDKNGDKLPAEGQAPEVTGAKPTAAQELEGR